jgi:hypothetical protein
MKKEDLKCCGNCEHYYTDYEEGCCDEQTIMSPSEYQYCYSWKFDGIIQAKRDIRN